ncbi:tail fiber domain-containing protein [Chryseobacterium kwangjuense]|uniref:Tail fiber domain-containing protein n=1 Tax=Chryseobacterium kwangjuense TaxID=267125 RepID=A0ABW9K937_9FLAO
MLKNFTTLTLAATLFSCNIISAQSVGVNTDKPGSTLDVNGSFAAKYTSVTAAVYSMTATDFHISYHGTANAVFTLPVSIAGEGNFKGRMYAIKNNTAFTVTVNPAVSETISGNTSVIVMPGQSLQLISTGLSGSASTWEVSGVPVTASNGLTLIGNEIKLGGTLLQNTAIDYADKALYLRSNVNGYGLTAISNSNAGTSAAALLQLTNNAAGSLNMFLNSSTKTTEGGANAATINNVGGPLTVAGNNYTSQLYLSQQTGVDYYYAGNKRLNIDGNGDISMNRPEVSETDGGNKIAATQGHLDLSGYNTLNGSSTQIYLGAQGFKYRYNGVTPMYMDGNGNVYAGSYNVASDMRLKTGIKDIGYGLETVMALQPKQYEISNHIEIKDGKPVADPGLNTKHKIGFLAQDLYKLVPEAVQKPKDDRKEIWTVDYSVLVPALTKAIQEQQAEIEQQTVKIKKMELEMQAVKNKLGL